jgi:hypothetical protein
MGWHPDDEDHRLGPKFAYGIQPVDLILIARRSRGEPETVGFGIVVGRFKTRLRGFAPPEPFGSLRRLDHFSPLSGPPASLPFLDALNQTAALHQLHPDQNPKHAVLCRWLDRKLAISGTSNRRKQQQSPSEPRKVTFGSLPNDSQLEYQVRSPQWVKRARKQEAALVARYRSWIEHQDRRLTIFRSHRIQCDAY